MWMDGWMDGSMDGWMDGSMDGWMDGWMDGSKTSVAPATGVKNSRFQARKLANGTNKVIYKVIKLISGFHFILCFNLGSLFIGLFQITVCFDTIIALEIGHFFTNEKGLVTLIFLLFFFFFEYDFWTHLLQY